MGLAEAMENYRGSKARGPCIADRLLADIEANPFSEAMPPEPGEQVYFIGSIEGPVKIGRSVAVQARLATLQTGCPTPIHILAVVDGGRLLERAYHEHFANDRLHGEWFRMSEALRLEIKRHAWD